jgi:pimeloyl-ACP methyl ester carboxylesterase
MPHLRTAFHQPLLPSPDANISNPIPLHLFQAANATLPQPVVLIITGLDHYHTFLLEPINALTSYGYAVLATPMPGTGDSPITARDPHADSLYWSAIVDWIQSKPDLFDPACISVWGVSAGSYWAIKASRLEKDRLRRVVSQGTASHYTFTRT